MFSANFTVKDFFTRLYEKAFEEEDLFSNAAQVGFYFTFALFPLLLFLISLIGLILTSAEALRSELFLYLRQIMPVSAFDLVQHTVNEVTASSSGGKLTLGILAALWAASAGIDSIRRELNAVYNLTETRSWWKTKLLALAMTFGLTILITIALGVIFYGGRFISLILTCIGFSVSSPFFLGVLQWVTILVVLITIFALIYNFLPYHKRLKWVWITPSAVVGIVLWLFLSYGFRLYLGFFNSYDKTYGSLGAVIILMLWLYLTALVILFGGTINAVLQEFSDPKTTKAGRRQRRAKMQVEDPEEKKEWMMSLMLQEIYEQPAVLERTIRNESGKLRRLGDILRAKDIDLIVLVARGSSDNAALFGRYLLEITCGIPVSLSAPSVFTLYGSTLDLSRALVIGVSQSGEGVDINTVLERAKQAGAFTLGITNEPDSTMSDLTDETLLIHAGRERSVAATKTYTGQMLHFYLLASLFAKRKLEFEMIPQFAAEALKLESAVREIVERYIFLENCVVVGRGLNYGNAYELALKLMETCYVVAERFSSADFLHGPLAVVERRFPVIMFAPSGVTKGNLDLLKQLKELHADSFSITNDAEIARSSSLSLSLPAEIDEFLSPIPFIIPAQLFAAHLAEAKGIDPDAPRSLSKVTKTI